MKETTISILTSWPKYYIFYFYKLFNYLQINKLKDFDKLVLTIFIDIWFLVK